MDALPAFLLMQWPAAGEVCTTALIVTGVLATLGSDPKRERSWLEGGLLALLTTYGGGVVAPMLVGQPPAILTNELIAPLVFLIYFILLRFPAVEKAARVRAVYNVFDFLAVVGRINIVVAYVDVASKVYGPGKYYPIVIFGPIMVGTLRGVGGMFLPPSVGVKALGQGVSWKLQMCFFTALFYHIIVNDPFLFGGVLRGVLFSGDVTRDGVRAVAVGLWLIITLVRYHEPLKDLNPFAPAQNALYAVSGVKRLASSSNSPAAGDRAAVAGMGNGGKEEEKEGGAGDGDTALYDLSARRNVQGLYDVGKAVLVAAVAWLAWYRLQPPAVLFPGQALGPGQRLEVCTALHRLRSCEPHSLVLEETGELVLYRGGGKADAKAEVLWSSPKAKIKPGQSLHAEVGEDGRLSVVVDGKNHWRSPLSSAGKRAINYGAEARLEAAGDGGSTLGVYKVGGLVWSAP